MPAFSFHWPRFLRLHRSHLLSNDQSQPAIYDGVAGSHYSGLSAPCSHPSPTAGKPIDFQSSAGHPLRDRAPQVSSSQPSQASPVTPISSSSRFDSAYQLGSESPEQPQLQIPLHSQCSLPTSSWKSLDGLHLTSPRPQGILTQAHDFIMTGPTFNNVIMTASNQCRGYFSYIAFADIILLVMKDLLKETIPGAAFNSSTRHPPPRCHPGTRLTILERCLIFITNCNGIKKIFWVFGAAGVGKSAIMQNVAESPTLPLAFRASIFFSVFGRNDTTKAVVTICYQLAVQSEVYRRLIEDEITRDPSLLQSSMPVQFNKFIVEPFTRHIQMNSTGRVSIIIDGLDECDDSHTQIELLRLISDFCTTCPSSPIVWFIASRPELHITSFFARDEMAPVYEKQEILVDSNEARADVERYLREELTEIKRASDVLDPKWPDERDCWKLANAAGGLFAYAHTAAKYIGDSTVGSPASQLSDVLNIIDRHLMTNIPREEHPLALLDALYARILSKIPSKIMINTRKLLLALATHWVQYLWYNDVGDLILLCNWLGMTPDDAYAALNHLRSVFRVPRRDKAYEEMFEPFHKSFLDYICDFTRSGFSADVKSDAQQITTQCALRILKEAPDGVDFDDISYGLYHGTLACGPGIGNNISLTWLADGNGGWSDDETRLKMYKLAIGEVVKGMIRGDPTFQNEFCIRVLTTRFRYYNPGFPYYQLCDSVFADSRRDEFMTLGILKQTSLGMIGSSNVFGGVQLQFCRPKTTVTDLSNPWDSSCTHIRTGEWGGGKDQTWVTTFFMRDCSSCSRRLRRQLETVQTRSPDCTMPVLLTSTGRCCVEFRFVGEEDGGSEWVYRFWYDRELGGGEGEEGN